MGKLFKLLGIFVALSPYSYYRIDRKRGTQFAALNTKLNGKTLVTEGESDAISGVPGFVAKGLVSHQGFNSLWLSWV